MEAPKCRICGERHWARLCEVTLPEPRNVTETHVTEKRNVTPRILEIEALTAEVVRLKRELADAGARAVACPECERRRQEVAARVRKHRKAKP